LYTIGVKDKPMYYNPVATLHIIFKNSEAKLQPTVSSKGQKTISLVAFFVVPNRDP
jgi:hypothetical protein